jgi:DNA repair photolyase
VRWQNLSADHDRDGRLPGVDDPPVVRTFDAPEAMGIRFHEVHARSALNSVPAASRMPFRWTINPYRGCTHACVYCLDGETEVLLASGRTARIAELSQGDQIYGTRREGRYRRYVRTTVMAHWGTRKPAYRVTLENGAETIASGDHRFLTRRGWKYVTGAEQGADRRPHLTLNDKLLGFGVALRGPEHNEEYRRGYLCGMLRGDAHIGSYAHQRTGRSGEVHRFRLALADTEALSRSDRFLRSFGVAAKRFQFDAGSPRRRPVEALRASSRDQVDRCRELAQIPRARTRDWRLGFLAGFFDAEGSHSRGVLRICNCDPELIDAAADCLRAGGHEFCREQRTTAGGRPITILRVRGGLASRMRLLAGCDPAITRKRSLDGLAVKSDEPLGVVSIEPLGERREMFDITTGTGDFIANGVISHNCFARPTHKYLDLNVREDFEREIVVKVNLPEVLRAELRRPSWKGEHVALGTNTDPYQWAEGRYRITRAVWEELLAARNPCSVLTKSPLLLRDLDLFRELAERTEFTANLSIPTVDERAWRRSEPHTPHPRKRVEAIAELTRAGIEVGVLVAPLMPGINDSPRQVEEVLRLCGEAGARSISGIGLHLRGEVRAVFFDWLRQHRPDLLPRYERLYARGAYLPQAERKRIAAVVAGARRRAAAGSGGPPRGIRPPTGRDPAPPAAAQREEAEGRGPGGEQPSLFDVATAERAARP